MLVVAAATQTDKTNRRFAPVQPIPFSHKKHAGELKLKCNMCHPEPGSGRGHGHPAGFDVHVLPLNRGAADSPAIQKLTEYAKAGDMVRFCRGVACIRFLATSSSAINLISNGSDLRNV